MNQCIPNVHFLHDQLRRAHHRHLQDVLVMFREVIDHGTYIEGKGKHVFLKIEICDCSYIKEKKYHSVKQRVILSFSRAHAGQNVF